MRGEENREVMTVAGPVWLLDVDGVLNAIRPGWGEAPHQGRVFADGIGWKFRWSPSLLAFVRSVASQREAEIRWATTWVPWARDLEATFRLPVLPEAFGADEKTSFPSAKLTAALRVVEVEQRPLVWTDDDAIPGFGLFRDRLMNAGVPVLLVAPQPNRGLQPEDVDAIRAFLSDHRAG